MTILSAKNTPRNSYTATSSQTDFTIGFEFFAVADVKVYKNGTLMTYNASPSSNTTYKITGTASASDSAYEFGAGGTVTFGSGLAADDEVVIIRDIAVERTADFVPSGAFDITTLNTQLDTMISMIADTQQQTDRSVKLLDTDTVSATVTLPAKATRASKVLSFDSDGNAESTVSTTGLSTLSGITSDITTVAGISSNVTSVASNATNINTVAGNNSNITTVAGVSGDVTTVAGVSSNVTTVAGISSNVTTVAGISSAVSTVASDTSNISTVASGISNVNTVAGSISNVNTVASNVSGVNSFAERYRVGSSDPSSSLDAGDLFFNTTSNTLKFYDSSSWNVIASTFSIDGASDTNLTSPADGALLLYDTGTSKFIDNVVSGDATLADTGALTIADNAITTAKINADAVTGAKIADDAINSEHYTDGSIDTAHIADNQITNAKMADDSVGSAELIDNSVGAAALNISGNGSSGQMIVSDADGSFSYADVSSAYNYVAVSGTTPALDLSAGNFFNQGALTGNTTVSFSNVPTQAQWSYTFAGALVNSFDIANATNTSNSYSSSGAGYAGNYGLAILDNGTKLYIGAMSGTASSNLIRQFTLTTAYDITTATHVRDFNVNKTYLIGFTFKPDGTKFYTSHFAGSDQDTIAEFTMSTAYNISTASLTDTFSTASQIGAGDLRGVKFNHDGTIAYAWDTGSNVIYQYTCSTAYDLSTISYANKSFSVGSSLFDIEFNSDTTKMFINHSSGTNADEFRRYSLSTASDISTASYDSVNFDYSSISTSINNLFFAKNGTKLYISEAGQVIYELDTGSGATITLPAAVQNTPSEAVQSTGRYTYQFWTADGGTNVFISNEEKV